MKTILFALLLFVSSQSRALDLKGIAGGGPGFNWELTWANSFSHLPGPAIQDKRYWKFLIGGCLQNPGRVNCKVQIENSVRGEYHISCRAPVQHKDAITSKVEQGSLSAQASVQDMDREWYNRMSFGIGDRLVSPRAQTLEAIRSYAINAVTPGLRRLTQDLRCTRN